MWTTNLWALVPFESKPTQRINSSLNIFIRNAFLVCIFYTKNEGATGMSGIGPIKERCPNIANVEIAGR
jgi:hypothetical protein